MRESFLTINVLPGVFRIQPEGEEPEEDRAFLLALYTRLTASELAPVVLQRFWTHLATKRLRFARCWNHAWSHFDLPVRLPLLPRAH
jgi:hypothetical protein